MPMGNGHVRPGQRSLLRPHPAQEINKQRLAPFNQHRNPHGNLTYGNLNRSESERSLDSSKSENRFLITKFIHHRNVPINMKYLLAKVG